MTHDTHTLPKIWGGVKKTSPMEGDVFFTGDKQTDVHTYIHTHGHCDSMTESAQAARDPGKPKETKDPKNLGNTGGYQSRNL